MENLKNNCIQLINESGLSLEAVYFVIKDLYRDVEEAFIQEKMKKKQQEENEEENE